MLQAVRIEGLRSLTDTGFIDIKPLTILVGENSSGKSTFLRFFPLLKQSFEANTSGPILWTGYVNFGTYREVHQHNSPNGIKFHISFNLDGFLFRRIFSQQKIQINLSIELSESKKKQTTRVSKIECQVEDSVIKIDISEDGSLSKYQVNSLDILELGRKFEATHLNGRSMLPIIFEDSQKDLLDFELYRFSRFRENQGIVFSKLYEDVKFLCSKAKSKDTVSSTVQYIIRRCIGNSNEILNVIKQANEAQYWKKNTKNWDRESSEFQRIRDLAIANIFPSFLEFCDSYIGSLSKNISYIGPSRATAEQRSQQVQEFAVNEIDSRGRNLALFLRDLEEKNQQAFNEWTYKYFGFRTIVKTNSGYITLNLIFDENQREINIADTGFGFSQMLPIITQLWFLSQKDKNSRDVNTLPIIFAIEQPELHLHPRMQKVLTDVLVSTVQAAKDNNIDLRLLIETHSEVLVNQVGNLIYKEKIKPEDVNIVVFDKLPQENSSTVKTAYYNEEGFLKKWPIGFFDPGLE